MTLWTLVSPVHVFLLRNSHCSDQLQDPSILLSIVLFTKLNGLSRHPPAQISNIVFISFHHLQPKPINISYQLFASDMHTTIEVYKAVINCIGEEKIRHPSTHHPPSIIWRKLRNCKKHRHPHLLTICTILVLSATCCVRNGIVAREIRFMVEYSRSGKMQGF